MTFYSPYAFLFLAAVPLIILLYLLKQRYREHEVSSLYLWREALKNIEADSPWQKLKKNLLMFLQILAVTLLAFALSGPFLNTAGNKAATAVIMIDASFSMQATDIGPSRFEAAKRQAAETVSGFRPGTRITLISIGGGTVIEENLNSDKNSVLKKLRQIDVTNCTADMTGSAAVLQSILSQYPDAAVYYFGDTIIYVPGADIKSYDYSRNGGNYAITLLSHAFSGIGNNGSNSSNGSSSSSSSGSGSITVLSGIANYTGNASVIPVSLYVDGRVFDARNVSVKPGETRNVYWSSVPSGASSIECRIDAADSLEGDNVAWDVVNRSKTCKVLLSSEKNIFLEKIISLSKGLKLYKTAAGSAGIPKGYDLYIFDGYIPDTLPAGGSIMLLNPPDNRLFRVAGNISGPSVRKSSHPLFNYINDYSFSISKARKIILPAWGETVLDSDEGPLIFAGKIGNRRILVFGFDLHDSDLAVTSSFPILMTNCFEWLAPSEIKNAESILPGREMDFNPDPEASLVRVRTPSGKTIGLAPPFPAGPFYTTGETGIYTLEQKTPDGIFRHLFAVNPPSADESNLQSGSKNPGKAAAVRNKNTTAQGAGFDLHGIILWSILALLILEWWVYKNGI